MIKRCACLVGLSFLAMPFREDPVMPPSNITQLVEDVRSGSPTVREAATEKLRDLGPAAKEAVPVLLDMLLLEKDKEVRECAASILMYIGEDAAPARPQLLRIFKDPLEDEDIRRMAGYVIADMGMDSLPILCQCLKDPDRFVRQWAADGFGRIGSSALGSVSALIEALEDGDSDVRSCAETSLAEMGEAALPALRESLGRLSDRARFLVCKLILKIEPGDRQMLALLATGMKHPDVEIRRNAVDIAHDLVDQASEQLFGDIEPLPYPKNLRWKMLVSPLLDALKDPDKEVRYWAAAALGELRSNHEQVVPALLNVLRHDPDEEVRDFAARSLGDFQARAAGAVRDLIQALERDEYAVRLAAIDALGDIGAPAREAAPLLQKACKSPDEEIRTRAKDALRKMREK